MKNMKKVVATLLIVLMVVVGVAVVPDSASAENTKNIPTTVEFDNEYKIADEEIGSKMEVVQFIGDKFAAVKEIEAMSAEERFAFWQEELSKCIRCNACRDICPACSCEQCIFDNQEAPVAGKAAADDVEEQLFHLIRAYHVAGRCVGCGECERVCPQGVKLGLLNMKFMKDINEFYGAFQAGEDATSPSPLVSYKDSDPEADEAVQRRG